MSGKESKASVVSEKIKRGSELHEAEMKLQREVRASQDKKRVSLPLTTSGKRSSSIKSIPKAELAAKRNVPQRPGSILPQTESNMPPENLPGEKTKRWSKSDDTSYNDNVSTDTISPEKRLPR